MSHAYTAPLRIRPLAICIFSHQGRILVNAAQDPVTQQTFFRPLGGGIEFGETSAATVTREIREELGLEAVELRLLGTLENLFTYCGAPHHEIVQVYDGAFANRSVYGRQFLEGQESDGAPFRAYWCGQDSFSSATPLYPTGLQELLEAKQLLK